MGSQGRVKGDRFDTSERRANRRHVRDGEVDYYGHRAPRARLTICAGMESESDACNRRGKPSGYVLSYGIGMAGLDWSSAESAALLGDKSTCRAWLQQINDRTERTDATCVAQPI
jgi:hypothetical protein